MVLESQNNVWIIKNISGNFHNRIFNVIYCSQKMGNNNYMFSNTSESIMFEQMPNGNKIPFKKISSNVFSVEPEWENEAGNVYQIFSEENR